MIKSSIKYSILLVVFTFILSIQIGERKLFDHIYGVIGPVSMAAQEVTEDLIEKSLKSTKEYSKKLFDNSVPKLKDSVSSGLSSRARKSKQEPAERITDSEKAELHNLIKNH